MGLFRFDYLRFMNDRFGDKAGVFEFFNGSVPKLTIDKWYSRKSVPTDKFILMIEREFPALKKYWTIE